MCPQLGRSVKPSKGRFSSQAFQHRTRSSTLSMIAVTQLESDDVHTVGVCDEAGVRHPGCRRGRAGRPGVGVRAERSSHAVGAALSEFDHLGTVSDSSSHFGGSHPGEHHQGAIVFFFVAELALGSHRDRLHEQFEVVFDVVGSGIARPQEGDPGLFGVAVPVGQRIELETVLVGGGYLGAYQLTPSQNDISFIADLSQKVPQFCGADHVGLVREYLFGQDRVDLGVAVGAEVGQHDQSVVPVERIADGR